MKLEAIESDALEGVAYDAERRTLLVQFESEGAPLPSAGLRSALKHQGHESHTGDQTRKQVSDLP